MHTVVLLLENFARKLLQKRKSPCENKGFDVVPEAGLEPARF